MRRSVWMWALSVLLSGCLGAGPVGGDAGGLQAASPEGVTARSVRDAPDATFIVVLHRGASAADVASEHGLSARHRYEHVLNGFAATVPAGRLAVLAGDPRVSWVEADQEVHIVAKPQPAPPPQPTQALPTGVDRVQADLSSTARINGVDERVGVGVAVIDTGVQLSHPDLNARNGATFVPGTKNANDDNGHGTHVAGTIGALDNGIGVVGVAPGAPVWAVKVLSRSGGGWISDVIRGVDWVAANAAGKGIRVANMSLGGGQSDALDTAVRNAVAGGVTFVLAAGNEARDASNGSPARVAEAITVSAIADSDGAPGGSGPSLSLTFSDGTYVYPDDVFARLLDTTQTRYSYSNYGAVVDLAAPGTAIRSTWLGGGYATLTGTSMAAPHVAGGAALVLATQPGLTPQQVRDLLVASGSSGYGYKNAQDDPDTIQEPLLDVGGF